MAQGNGRGKRVLRNGNRLKSIGGSRVRIAGCPVRMVIWAVNQWGNERRAFRSFSVSRRKMEGWTVGKAFSMDFLEGWRCLA